jgi:hypothetical protein
MIRVGLLTATSTAMLGISGAAASDYQVLYAFQGPFSGDGAEPWGLPAMDSHGNLFGTTMLGRTFNHGAVYELRHTTAGWKETVLYSFHAAGDGWLLDGGVILD